MKPIQTRSIGTMGRLAGALLAVAVLALGVGGRGATAADPPAPPIIGSVEAPDATTLNIRWTNSGPVPTVEHGVRINIYQGGKLISIIPVPGTPGVAAPEGRAVNGVSPDTRYCIGLLAYIGTGDNATSTFSEESETRCVTTPPLPTADLQVAQLPTVEQAGGVAGCLAGTANNVRVVISNAGDGGAAAFTMQLIVDQQPGATQSVGGVPGKQDTTYYFGNVSLTKGTHTLLVRLDIENKVAETDEDNNTSQPITVACGEGPAGSSSTGGVAKPPGASTGTGPAAGGAGLPAGGAVAGGELKPAQDPTDDGGDDNDNDDDNDNHGDDNDNGG
jgi:CARDB